MRGTLVNSAEEVNKYITNSLTHLFLVFQLEFILSVCHLLIVITLMPKHSASVMI